MAELLAMGPPVYFVLSTALPISHISYQNLLCGGQLCNQDSIVTKLYMASTSSEMYVCQLNVSIFLLLFFLVFLLFLLHLNFDYKNVYF